MGRDGRLLELPAPTGDDERPLYARLCARVRELVVDGALPAGARLPASRALAHDLEVSRTTVETAYAQLAVEGFITRRVGAGTFVAETLAPAPCAPRARGRSAPHARTKTPAGAGAGAPGSKTKAAANGGSAPGVAPLSARGEAIRSAARELRDSRALRLAACVPPAGEFPMRTWSRLLSRRARAASASGVRPAEAAGHPRLRRAIAAHVAATRGVRCEPDQVLVVTGTQQSLDLVARLLLDPGDPVWIEDPHYLGARSALAAAGAELVPVPVDGEGFDPARAEARRPDARLVYLTPSHQFPLGGMLSAARRLAVLEWAGRSGGWVIEDDYDSEFRYAGRPLASLQGLDANGRVVYLGSFNKVLFPAIRTGFLVAPPALAAPLRGALRATGAGPPDLQQAALADFIEEGHLARHIRRLRELYAGRRDALMEALRRQLGDGARIGPAETGMHFALHLPGGGADRAGGGAGSSCLDDEAVSARAARASLDLPPLSRYYLGAPRTSGVLVTFGAEPAARAEETARGIARVIQEPPHPEAER